MIPKSYLCTAGDMKKYIELHGLEHQFIFSQNREWVIQELYVDHKGFVKVKMIPTDNVVWSDCK